MALPRENRLPLRFERDRLTKEGKTVYSKYFTLVYAASSVAIPRFAILVSKKTAKLAVDRNKIKRLSSSLIQSRLLQLKPLDYLLIPKSSILSVDYSGLSEDFHLLLSRV